MKFFFGLVEPAILRYHTPLYLKEYGHAHQKSEMAQPRPHLSLHMHFLSPVPGLTRAELAPSLVRSGVCLF